MPRRAAYLDDHLARDVGREVSQKQSAVLAKVAVVKHEQELAATLGERLDVVRHARWKIPNVSRLEIADLVAALLVDGSDAERALHDVCPLGTLMPVELSNGTLCKERYEQANEAAV